ncbi:MAG: hypothetical protein JW720_09550 [Sedimentisphaerales bacterium]|nr:hypothetical protein [Sedimentisphaerales bacterium]
MRVLLEHRRLPVFLALLAIFVMLPALGHGWLLDDMMFRARLAELPATGSEIENTGGLFRGARDLPDAIFGLYAFFADEEGVKQIKDYGIIPWWTDPNCQISFWRPVTSFTIWLDYQLFPDSAPLQHLHSILWYAGAVFVLTVLYRRIGGAGWIAGLAALLYVLEACNYMPVAFIANRNAVIALLFGVSALLMHDKWRRGGGLPEAVLSCLLLGLSLLSAEAGIATAGYLGAYALGYEQGKWSRRMSSLIPAAAVVIAWRIVHGALGYATHASGVYIDPGAEPLHFAAAVFERGPIMLFAQLFGSAADAYYFFSDSARVKVLAVILVILAMFLAVLAGVLRRDRAARFWFLGMVFAVVPVCATMASNRNLLFIGVGAMGLIAQFTGPMLSGQRRPQGRRLLRMPVWTFCGVLVFVHVPCSIAGRIAAPFIYSRFAEISEMSFDIDLPDKMRGHDVVTVNSPMPLFLIGLPAKTALEGRGIPRSLRVLAPAFSPLKVTRIADKVLEVRAMSGSLLFWERPKEIWLHLIFFAEEFNTIFRDPRHGFEAGETIEAGRMVATIKAVDGQGQPVAVEFRFDVSLDDPSMLWYRWQYDWKEPYVRFEVPAVGESVEIAGVPF